MQRRGSVILWVGLVVVIVAGIGLVAFIMRPKEVPVTPPGPQAGAPMQPPNGAPLTAKQPANEWQDAGPALAGTYADADIVTLADGSYRMYAATQPEVAGNNFEIYSATSTDGINWKKEAGNRKVMATFPDVFTLPDGSYRMNFQGAGAIKSATSKDGLTFTDEAGTRINSANDAGLALTNVAAPSTLKLADGSYLMVYRGTLAQQYQAELVPNRETTLLLYATSPDGKTWTKKGIAVDTRTSTTLKGWSDGPELIDYDGQIRLYLSTYTGVYYSVFKDGTFSTPKFSWQLADKNNPNNAFGGIPPGDPTLLKVGKTWYMYFGKHPEGIYYAVLAK